MMELRGSKIAKCPVGLLLAILCSKIKDPTEHLKTKCVEMLKKRSSMVSFANRRTYFRYMVYDIFFNSWSSRSRDKDCLELTSGIGYLREKLFRVQQNRWSKESESKNVRTSKLKLENWLNKNNREWTHKPSTFVILKVLHLQLIKYLADWYTIVYKLWGTGNLFPFLQFTNCEEQETFLQGIRSCDKVEASIK